MFSVSYRLFTNMYALALNANAYIQYGVKTSPCGKIWLLYVIAWSTDLIYY